VPVAETALQVALLTDPDPRVRAAAAKAEHPGVPAELYERCLSDSAVQADVARRVPLTRDQFVRLLEVGDEGVLHAVAGNPHLTAEMVAQLQENSDPFVRMAVALSRHTTPETRHRLIALVEAEKASGSIDARIAIGWPAYEPRWLREVPLAERLSYLDCPHTVFRRVLAAGRDLPDEVWQRLDEDPDVSVRRAAARRPGTPPRVLVRLLREHGEVFHIRPLLVDHPNFPREALRTFVDEPDPRVRVLALEDPELPVPELWRFTDSEHKFLRAGAARHPNVTADLLERLLADREPKVVDEAAANRALPHARMGRILTDSGL
jgi:hypothetical protein